MDQHHRWFVADDPVNDSAGEVDYKCPRGSVESVAAAIALAVEDDRAAGRLYNVSEPFAYSEGEWVQKIGEITGWRGPVVTVSSGRIPLPYRVNQHLDTNSARIRRELGFTEVANARAALERTIAWERTNPGGQSRGIGLLEYDAEDAQLASGGETSV